MKYLRKHWPVLLSAVVPTAMLATWFVAVDWCWYVDQCDRCGTTIDVTQIRILTYPIHEEELHHGERLADRSDLPNEDCQHPNFSRWLKQRWLGMVYCCCPCHNGTTGLAMVPLRRLKQAKTRSSMPAY